MELRNIDSQTKIENAADTIVSRDGVESVSLLHQNGINVKSTPLSIDTQLDEIARISSTIFSLTHKIHDHNWDFVVLECEYGTILLIPLLFYQSDEECPFFLQIVTQSNIKLKNLLSNIQNPISIIIDELSVINEEFQSLPSHATIVLDDNLNFQRTNPEIGTILSNYFGPASSLDIESVDVYISDKSLNSIGIHENQTLGFNQYELNCVWTILSWSEKLTQLLKKTTITSIRIDYGSNFHFIYPLGQEKIPYQGSFLSINTKSQSKFGYLSILTTQIIQKIEKCIK